MIPFPLTFEVLFMYIGFELIREAGIRIPSPFGSTIGIVGALLVEAAVSASLVSPIMVIVIAYNRRGILHNSKPGSGNAHTYSNFDFHCAWLCSGPIWDSGWIVHVVLQAIFPDESGGSVFRPCSSKEAGFT